MTFRKQRPKGPGLSGAEGVARRSRWALSSSNKTPSTSPDPVRGPGPLSPPERDSWQQTLQGLEKNSNSPLSVWVDQFFALEAHPVVPYTQGLLFGSVLGPDSRKSEGGHLWCQGLELGSGGRTASTGERPLFHLSLCPPGKEGTGRQDARWGHSALQTHPTCLGAQQGRRQAEHLAQCLPGHARLWHPGPPSHSLKLSRGF